MKMKRCILGLAAMGVLVCGGQVRAGIVFGVKSKAPSVGISTPPTHLFSFESDGSSFSDLGAIKLSGSDIDADGLALSPTYGLRAFELTSSGSTYVSIDSTTAVVSAIGTILGGREIRGATFDLSDRLWVLDAQNDQLLQINPTTGATIGAAIGLTLGGNPFNLSTAADMAVRADGTFYVNSSINFYTLDISTGTLTLVGSDPVGDQQAPAGIAFSLAAPSYAMFAYDINGPDDLFEYDVDSSFARTTLYPNIISSFNAGRGDLAAVIIPEPASLIVWSLLGGWAAVCVWWRRRRKAG